MTPDEVNKVAHIDRTEHIHSGYEMRDGRLHQLEVRWDTPAFIREGEGEHTISAQVAFCQGHLDKGAVMYGAFDGDQLVGIGLLTPEICPKMDQLAYLQVSRSHRRRGIAHKIVSKLERGSRKLGTNQLYVSATPSASAVGFYLDFGFVPVEEPLPELYELEPEDIHMVKHLNNLHCS